MFIRPEVRRVNTLSKSHIAVKACLKQNQKKKKNSKTLLIQSRTLGTQLPTIVRNTVKKLKYATFINFF